MSTTPQHEPPAGPNQKRRSLLSLLMAGVLLLLTLAGLSLLTIGFAPLFGALVVLIVLAIGGLVAFHYVVWGWWLGDAIRREVEAEERNESPPPS
jgi:hypothetical protein